jgi:hypothetical protein
MPARPPGRQLSRLDQCRLHAAEKLCGLARFFDLAASLPFLLNKAIAVGSDKALCGASDAVVEGGVVVRCGSAVLGLCVRM